MKQVMDVQGRVEVMEVPPPMPEAGCILVRTAFSCISPGTELSGLKASSIPLWRRALKNPEKIKKLYSVMQQQGASAARNLVAAKTHAIFPLGYSLSGHVVACGEGVSQFRVGEAVAGAGSQCAFHAEYVNIPVNLAVSVPRGLELETASTVALGAIALQGVRRVEPTFGETVLVIGMGILGQLTAQLLRASGCRVLVSDLREARARLVVDSNMICRAGENLAEDVMLHTQGIGVDAVVITASGGSEALMQQAFRSCRKKGRVILVGDVPLVLDRNDMYLKELDFRISTSYGPGRYEPAFEEDGLDFPLPYVRWTETRNMSAYLEALVTKRLEIGAMVSGVYDVRDAKQAFDDLRTGESLLSLLRYSTALPNLEVISEPLPASVVAKDKRVNLAVIGAGSFVENVHLPNLQKLKQDYSVTYAVCKTGHHAEAIRRRFAIANAAADWKAPIADDQVEAVLVGTRHHLHAAMTLAALRAGKHVLVEKPLALTRHELEELKLFYRQHAHLNPPILMTGFNRRFSPAALRAREIFKDVRGPLIINYTMNAGFIAADHWVHGAQGGGRNLGEACHIYDLFVYLTRGAQLVSVKVTTLGRHETSPFQAGDNFQASFSFSDGSLCTLLYTAMGNAGHPKETMQIFGDSQIFTMDDYKSSTWTRGPGQITVEKHQSKGHYEELVAFARGLREGQWPIPLGDQVLATEMALAVQENL